ncbi:hypothetical protein ACFL2B_01955 [Patescibacteria group bacterium]
MKNYLRIVIVSVSICLIFMIAWPVFADRTIGISPSELNEELPQGQKKDINISLSRADTEGDLTFNVTLAEPMPMINLSQEQVTIPAGENEVDYTLSINTWEVSPGDYDNVVNFHIADEQTEMLVGEESGAVDITIGLGLKFSIRVTPGSFFGTLNKTTIYVIIAVVAVVVFFVIAVIVKVKKKKRT